jgi:hypothetical protein
MLISYELLIIIHVSNPSLGEAAKLGNFVETEQGTKGTRATVIFGAIFNLNISKQLIERLCTKHLSGLSLT